MSNARTARPTRPAARPQPTVRPTHQTVRPVEGGDEGPVQDMWRPRSLFGPGRLPAWHPSLMQLLIGAALVAALLGACNALALDGIRDARQACLDNPTAASCAYSAPTDGGAAADTEEAAEAATQSRTAAQAGGGAHVYHEVGAPSTPGAPTAPTWVTEGATPTPYAKDDPAASPLDLPACTTAPDQAVPCLAAHTPARPATGSPERAVVLEEDLSLTAYQRG